VVGGVPAYLGKVAHAQRTSPGLGMLGGPAKHVIGPDRLRDGLALFGRIHAALKPGGLYVELDDVASPATEKRSLELYEQHIAGKEGDSIGEWNHNMNLTIPHERELLEQAGFAEVTVPWRNTDDEGFGRAVFVCRK
jgi:hypothetical protein